MNIGCKLQCFMSNTRSNLQNNMGRWEEKMAKAAELRKQGVRLFSGVQRLAKPRKAKKVKPKKGLDTSQNKLF